jgi:hypothetical protein
VLMEWKVLIRKLHSGRHGEKSSMRGLGVLIRNILGKSCNASSLLGVDRLRYTANLIITPRYMQIRFNHHSFYQKSSSGS